MDDNITDKQLQKEMHKDFFVRCQNAINNGCYFEAMLMEYAAIEGRLEVIMGVLGLPCNKQLPSEERRKIYVSNRLTCLREIYLSSNVLADSPIPRSFWKKLEKWIRSRNMYIHGLYKNEIQYKSRMKDVESIAKAGYDYANTLYKEAKRLRRLLRKGVLSESSDIECNKSLCAFIRNKTDNSEQN